MENDKNTNDGKDVKKTKSVCVTMSIPYKDKLDKHCEETGLTVSDVIRRALDSYFKTL